MHDTPRFRSTSRTRRVFTTLAAVMTLTLGAAACGSAEPTITTADAGTTQAQTQTSESTTQDSAPTDTSVAPVSDEGHGEKPLLQTWSISAEAIRYSGNLAGFDYTFTEISDRDRGIDYFGIGDDSGIRASYLANGDDYLHVCVETGDGCGGGAPPELFFSSIEFAYAAWAPQSFDDGLRVAGGILLGESVGWEISDANYTLDGRPGRCYRSLGAYQWPGDEEPTTTSFPAGDVACVLFYETSSEYLVSYDFGGDGTLELQTTRLADTYTDADFERPAYAPAGDDPAALAVILDNEKAQSDYQILNLG